MGISLQDHAREISKIYARHEKEIERLTAEVRQLKFENEVMLESLHEEGVTIDFASIEESDKAYEAAVSGSQETDDENLRLNPWCDECRTFHDPGEHTADSRQCQHDGDVTEFRSGVITCDACGDRVEDSHK